MKIERDQLTLQIFLEEDLQKVIETFNFPWTSPEVNMEKWRRYYAEQKADIRLVCIAKYQDQFIGYGSLVKNSEYPGFRNNSIPEIHDVWILEEYRGNGFGKKLIKHLEELAREENYAKIGLGVGLYKDYGAAQKLYVSMGYLPDGMGVTYKYQAVIPGNLYSVDDDLVLWLKKELSF